MSTKDTIGDTYGAVSQSQESLSLAAQQLLIQEYETSERYYVDFMEEKTRQMQRFTQLIDVSTYELQQVRIMKAAAIKIMHKNNATSNVPKSARRESETDRQLCSNERKEQMNNLINGNHETDGINTLQPKMEGSQVLQAEVMDSAPMAQDRQRPQWPLSLDEYRRYGRQLIVPEIGLQGRLWWWVLVIHLADSCTQANYALNVHLSLL